MGEEFVDPGGFVRTYHRCYPDYEQCRGEIRRVVHQSNRGIVGSPDEALAEVVNEIGSVVTGRDADFCVGIAALWLRRSETVDPDDRYFFQAHVPVVHPLDGDRLLLHECLVDALGALADRMDVATTPTTDNR